MFYLIKLGAEHAGLSFSYHLAEKIKILSYAIDVQNSFIFALPLFEDLVSYSKHGTYGTSLILI